jgi:hypothetical protein
MDTYDVGSEVTYGTHEPNGSERKLSREAADASEFASASREGIKPNLLSRAGSGGGITVDQRSDLVTRGTCALAERVDDEAHTAEGSVMRAQE